MLNDDSKLQKPNLIEDVPCYISNVVESISLFRNDQQKFNLGFDDTTTSPESIFILLNLLQYQWSTSELVVT
jgi:hypothetical protein